MKLDNYQRFTLETDHNPRAGIDGLGFLLLGLFGEVGSLLSVLKRKQRDKSSLVAYREAVIEEFGDALWYFSSVAQYLNIQLSEIVLIMPKKIYDWKYKGLTKAKSFISLQPGSKPTKNPIDIEVERYLLFLAGKVGTLMSVYSQGCRDKKTLAEHLTEIFPVIIAAADVAGVNLNTAAESNMKKAYSRWPKGNKKDWGNLYDDNEDTDEQLPRKIKMVFKEKSIGQGSKKRTYVLQQCNKINIGDRLTDNRMKQDDYRFHDVFHLAYAAILGWSPVLRALLKVKRKSKPSIDENQDGARAIIIEEGVATWIFNQAERYEYFKNIKSIDYPLLKSVLDLVKGYEVDNRPVWQWEHAILEGFRIFREIQKHRGGTVTADLLKHKISFEPL